MRGDKYAQIQSMRSVGAGARPPVLGRHSPAVGGDPGPRGWHGDDDAHAGSDDDAHADVHARAHPDRHALAYSYLLAHANAIAPTRRRYAYSDVYVYSLAHADLLAYSYFNTVGTHAYSLVHADLLAYSYFNTAGTHAYSCPYRYSLVHTYFLADTYLLADADAIVRPACPAGA